ncbi:MAG: threonine--tRNA ligase, partial [Oscillospiraceae bacterium]|nr:threonine--tRNA ligase [Oscillospiraceae bacterium]
MDEKKESQYTFENAEYRQTYWHTCSHIMAQAVKRLWPEVRLAIGPSIAEGWYYDLSAPFAFTPEHMTQIEEEMRKICKEKLKIERFELPRDEALELMRDEPFKLELIRDLPDDVPISFYRQGEFTDLCAGPHLDSTGRVKGNAIRLLTCNASYWRGDSSRESLQRIYGIAFPKKDALDAYLQRIEEAKKRDHRRLGRELGLFLLMDEGPGFPFFLPKGMTLRNTLIDYWREVHHRYGYVEISTPVILNRALWERSGHWDHYKENMYTTVIDGEDYAVKPMNCPGGMLVYASEPHSYRDLPLRCGELGLVHRHELSGALHGLFRVRCFTQDDAHIFMTREQMQDEIVNTVRLFDEVYSTFGLHYNVELSTMPEDHIGTEAEWEQNQNILKNALTSMGKTCVVNEGDGAFYGPKLDFHIEDCLGRTWQCGTVQLDSQLPERFALEYVGA